MRSVRCRVPHTADARDDNGCQLSAAPASPMLPSAALPSRRLTHCHLASVLSVAGAALLARPTARPPAGPTRFFARKMLCGMVTHTDEMIGDIVQALNESDVIDTSVIIFMGDNGGYVDGFL